MKSNFKKIALTAGLSAALSTAAFAEGETTAATSNLGSYSTIIWLVAMLAMFYFLIIRPQKKREKAERQLRNSLEPGDKIITIGGFTGRVLSIKDDEVTFETGASKTRLTVKKWAIQTKEQPEGAKEAKADTKEVKEPKDEVKAAEATPDDLSK